MRAKRVAILIVVTALVIVAIVIAIIIGRSDNQTVSRHHAGQTTQSSSQKSATKKPVATDTVTIQNYAFNPAAITIKVGTTVTWTNQDSVHHTVTSDSGASVSFDSGDMAQGQTYRFTFTQPGTYTYHCTPHPFMHGTVIVTQ